MNQTNQAIMRAVGGVMREHLLQIAEKFRSIEGRIEGMNTTIADAYQGVYREGTQYERGHLITHGGGLWLVMRSTEDRPGSGDAMRLIVKRGTGGQSNA